MKPPSLAGLLALAAASVTLLGAGSAAGETVGCGQVIEGDVTLTADLVCPGDGLVVSAQRATIDLDGHSIVGSGGGVGISVARACGDAPGTIAVVDGTVTGFEWGVVADGDGCFEGAPVALTFDRLHVSGNGTGISYLGGRGGVLGATVISRSAVTRNAGNGIVTGHAPISVVDSRVSRNGGHGLSADEDSLEALEGSTFSDNGETGALLRDTVARVSGNTFSANGAYGLFVQERLCDLLDDYVIRDNVADRNAVGGINVAIDASCDPAPAPPQASGNAAKHNGAFQCTGIACAPNRGGARAGR